MAKYVPSALVKEIMGSVGDSTFSYWRGIPRISKKARKKRESNTLPQRYAKKNFSKLSSNWGKLSFREWNLWEEYAKKYTNIKYRRRDGLLPAIGGKMSGIAAYMSVNGLLTRCGFKPLKKPPLGKIPKPTFPSTNLIDFRIYKPPIKFKIWLPYPYETQTSLSKGKYLPQTCVAQIWIKKIGHWTYPYIRDIVPLSTSKTQVILDKIRMVTTPTKVVEKELKEIENCRLLLQMRTVAQNGEFSMPGPIYKIEVK